eukprot:NODE_5746_length_616_cov_17.687117_g5582_i0.p2 GENE.NODE_5746_length_616_cov_17.687117_g5582_i0~~NODE_5746_length_616_cov_17.687117_g5582_i0.p2  ORF type:complete len:184 (+),score=61.91 NODE_5746_length_616_cov_17.687117_g5582_i0:66-554(+)
MSRLILILLLSVLAVGFTPVEVLSKCQQLIINFSGSTWEDLEAKWFDNFAEKGQFFFVGVPAVSSKTQLREVMKQQWDRDEMAFLGTYLLQEYVLNDYECIVEYVTSYMVLNTGCGPVLRRGWGIVRLNQEDGKVNSFQEKGNQTDTNLQIASCRASIEGQD